jgi:uncharacterized protein (DUF433 family)
MSPTTEPKEAGITFPPDRTRELLARITRNPAVMTGRPCLRGLRVTVSMVVGLVASGHSTADILRLYPYLEEDDVRAALTYAAWRVGDGECPLPPT